MKQRRKRGRGNRNYRKGRRFEYVERDYQAEQGFWVQRAYGSYGIWDVLATNGIITRFIQVKSSEKRRSIKSYKKDIARLKEIAAGPGVERLLVLYAPVKPGVKTPRQELKV